jgi:iron complex transport system substrate-binding protein
MRSFAMKSADGRGTTKRRAFTKGFGAALCLGLCVAGCGKNAPANQSAGTGLPARELYWKTESRPGANGGAETYVVDQEGNAVPLTIYRRMALLSPAAVETLYLVGGEEAIVTIAASSLDPVWPPEKTALLPTVGNPARPSLEAIIAAEPDLVIGSSMNIALVKDLGARGIPAIVNAADSLEDIFYSARVLGAFCGREKEAEALIGEKRNLLEELAREIRKEPPGLKGAFLYSVNPVMAFTANSLAGDILAVLGVENIAADLDAAQPILSPEYLLTENPDFLFGAVFIPGPEAILGANQAIAKTRAGREGNISIVPSSLLLRPSPRIVDGLLELHGKIKSYKRD